MRTLVLEAPTKRSRAAEYIALAGVACWFGAFALALSVPWERWWVPGVCAVAGVALVWLAVRVGRARRTP